ncbi:hypothetical protein [Flagellimonas pacifica]|uniref:Uncharacterized protein n=1 Tax=Flagellimonas pacifica TaxID=1247520 RepID=A0A285MVK3_9FLAO|nr:hypothetical protein [Allomuricauda parva]SNZ00567.1 hypothetical protein SAMN06265377_2391 [Allomuricauda parva]
MDNNTFEYDGKCAFALSLGKEAPKTNGKHTITKGGKTYTFLNPVAKFLFKLFPNSIQKADTAWNKNR